MPGTVLDAGETKMTKTWYFPSRSSQFSNGNRYLGRQCSYFFYFNFSFYNAQFKKTGKYTQRIKLHIIPSPKNSFFSLFIHVYLYFLKYLYQLHVSSWPPNKIYWDRFPISLKVLLSYLVMLPKSHQLMGPSTQPLKLDEAS